MNKMDIMIRFIEMIDESNLMTDFIKNIYGYKNINDYNYMFRVISNDNEIVIDIYDNFSVNRFNRYVFKFDNCDYVVLNKKQDYLFIKYISVLNVDDNNNNLYKLAYLFSLDNDKMLDYASSFLDIKFVDILKRII